MDNVVYLLGAGFSAPLGLPTMNNFLIKSKDMYFEDPDKYEHFQQVFSTIKNMSVSKNYYETDLFNIEEILSILEMGRYLEERNLEEWFLRYIADVIQYHTPNFIPYPGDLPGNWHDFIFGKSELWKFYSFFIGNIQNLIFKSQRGQNETRSFIQIRCRQNRAPEAYYSIITLNYDLIPEIICQFITEKHEADHEISFGTELRRESISQSKPILAKLHGSIDKNNIVAPTWNKGGIKEKILKEWKLAHNVLIDANHLRIMGYSLPQGDAYVKYLLKSAAMESPHLKSIDVICRDPDGTVRKKYGEFIKLKYFRFADANITDYLQENHKQNYDGRLEAPQGGGELVLNKLENAHEDFMESYTQTA